MVLGLQSITARGVPSRVGLCLITASGHFLGRKGQSMNSRLESRGSNSSKFQCCRRYFVPRTSAHGAVVCECNNSKVRAGRRKPSLPRFSDAFGMAMSETLARLLGSSSAFVMQTKRGLLFCATGPRVRLNSCELSQGLLLHTLPSCPCCVANPHPRKELLPLLEASFG
jgi:hypothetical protein